jgi:hypothetical protein
MGEPTLLLDLEGHGREEIFDDVDLSGLSAGLRPFSQYY